MLQDARRISCGQGRKYFFFEKKKQKTFTLRGFGMIYNANVLTE